MDALINRASVILQKSFYAAAFTGAGISVESGIPPFRGPEGLWSKYDPQVLDIDFFHSHPDVSWTVIKEIFYDFFGKANPNKAHFALAKMEKAGILKSIITQNIDNLHQEAGSNNVIEFHGSSHSLVCTSCGKKYNIDEIDLNKIPVICPECGGILKPDFVFFGEGIPTDAYQGSYDIVSKCDVLLIIGTTGEIMPASQLPFVAKTNGATIIEVNTNPSNYTDKITDIFLQGKATDIMVKLLKAIHLE